jgi:hypothetical protein
MAGFDEVPGFQRADAARSLEERAAQYEAMEEEAEADYAAMFRRLARDLREVAELMRRGQSRAA